MKARRTVHHFLGLLSALLLTFGCSPQTMQAPVAETFTAEMLVTADGVSTHSRIWARKGLLRMSMAGGRAASGMIASYREKRCWALMPAAARYQEFPIDSLRQRIPHFFDPSLTIDKTFLGHESVDGETALKYDATITSGGRRYRGILWEAEQRPGFPLKWQDSERDLIACWRNARLVDLPESFFRLPPGYSEQKHPAPDPDRNETHCRCRDPN